MKIEGFPGCCGAAIFSQLHAVGGNYSQYDTQIEDGILKFMKQGLRKGITQPAFVDERIRSVSIAITVERMRDTEALLKKLGGKVVAKFTNRNTGGVNRIWVIPNLEDVALSRVSTNASV